MQYLQLTIDRLAAGRLGLDIEQIQQILRAQIEGLSIGIVQEGVRRTPLVIKGDSNSANFDSLQITLSSGGSVPLSSVAKLEKVDGMVSIQREYSQRFVVVRSNVEGRDLVGFVDGSKAGGTKSS